MALSENIFVDELSVECVWFTISVRTRTEIMKDGEVIARSYSRKVIHPGDDVSEMSQDIINITNSLWTQERVDAYQAMMQQNAEV